jgi:hypothetical protein
MTSNHSLNSNPKVSFHQQSPANLPDARPDQAAYSPIYQQAVKFKETTQADDSSLLGSRLDSQLSRKQSRYSPLNRPYNESKSPSVISHLNTAINEEIRSKIKVDEETESLVKKFEDLMDSNKKKVHSYLDDLELQMFRFKTEAEKTAFEKIEMREVVLGEEVFCKKKKLSDDCIQSLRKKIEDRELIYRAIHKHAKYPKQLNQFLQKKTAEIQSDNKREQDQLKRTTDLLRSEERALKRQLDHFDQELTEREKDWAVHNHQLMVRAERVGREEMTGQSLQIILKYFQLYSRDPKYAQVGDRIKELIAHRDYYRQRLEEEKLLHDETRLLLEVDRLERELDRLSSRS